jgi:hypothetical protein
MQRPLEIFCSVIVSEYCLLRNKSSSDIEGDIEQEELGIGETSLEGNKMAGAVGGDSSCSNL